MLALQITMDLWSLIASLFSILHTVHTDTTRTSKACYGTHTDTLPCTTHYINCNSTGKIVICDAYFTNNRECGLTGLSSCPNNLDHVTEHGYLKFNSRELAPVYKNCSREPRCAYPAPRRGEGPNFSVVKYHCIENQTVKFFNKSEICQKVRFTTAPTEDISLVSTSSRFQVGLFVGGVAVGVVMVILVGLAVYVLIVRPRYNLTPKKQGDTQASVEHPTYSGMSAGGDVNNYDIIEQTSGFQGETAHEVVSTPEYKNI